MSVFDGDLIQKRHIINAGVIRGINADRKIEKLSHDILDGIIEDVLKYIFYKVSVCPTQIDTYFSGSVNEVSIPCNIFGVDGGCVTDIFSRCKNPKNIYKHPNIIYVIGEFRSLGFNVSIDYNNRIVINWDDMISKVTEDDPQSVTSRRGIFSKAIDSSITTVQPMPQPTGLLTFFDPI